MIVFVGIAFTKHPLSSTLLKYAATAINTAEAASEGINRILTQLWCSFSQEYSFVGM